MSMLSPAGGAKSVTSQLPVLPASPGAPASVGSVAELPGNFATLLRGSIAPQPAAIAPASEAVPAQAATNKSAAKAQNAKPGASGSPAAPGTPNGSATANQAHTTTPQRETAPAEGPVGPAATPAGRAKRAVAAEAETGEEADTAALHKLVMAQLRAEPIDPIGKPTAAAAARPDQAQTDATDAIADPSRAAGEASTSAESSDAGPDGAKDVAKSADPLLVSPDPAALAALMAHSMAPEPATAPAAAATGTAMSAANSTPAAGAGPFPPTLPMAAAGVADPDLRTASDATEARRPVAGADPRTQPEPSAASGEATGTRPTASSVPAAAAARSIEAAEPVKASRGNVGSGGGESPIPTPTIAAPPQFTLPQTATSEVRQINLREPLQAPEFSSALAARVSLLAVEGVQQAQLHLNPAEMGPVAIQINIDGQQAQVAFHAEMAETCQVLEQSLPELAAALRESGLTLSGGGVFQQMNQQARDERGEHDEAHRTARSSTREFAIGGDTAPRGPAAVPVRAQHGMLDLYA